MLPKINRLKKAQDIEQVFKRGNGRREGFLFIKSVKNNLSISRLTFIVSKKVSQKASDRNKIKRRLRESAKPLLPLIKTGFDAAIIALKGIETESFQKIKNIMQVIFEKSNLLKL